MGVTVDLELNSETENGNTTGVGYVLLAGCPDDEESPHSELCGTFEIDVCKSAACGPPGESAEETGTFVTLEYSTIATDC